MDRISDSGSDGCGSIPHGGTKNLSANGCGEAFVYYDILLGNLNIIAKAAMMPSANG